MSANLRITMFPGALKVIKDAQILAIKQTAEQIMHENVSDAIIPFDTGNTQNVSTYVETTKSKKGIVSIVSDSPYAARIYFHPEYNFQTTTNVNAKGMWMEQWLTGSKALRPVALYKQFLRYNSGGFIT